MPVTVTVRQRSGMATGYHEGEQKENLKLLQVFGDESHDPKCERVFAAAALFGTEEQWAAFRPLWTERLGGRVFHASDCETDHGEFADTPHSENLQLYADLTKLLANSTLLGFGSAMDLAGYYELFGDAPADIPYYRCFRDVVWQCGKWAKWAIPADTAEFHFDQRVESDYNAGVLYGHIAILPDWDCAKFLRTPLKISSRTEVGIQAADLYAREVMKHLDNTVGPVKRPMRRSMAALRATNRFGCDLHLREFFEDFKRKFDGLAVKTGMNVDHYRQWLGKHGQADSISSRHRYLIDLDGTEAAAQNGTRQ